MSQLLGPNGKPISSADYAPKNKKSPPPALGEQYGQWAGDEVQFLKLPGGGAIAFNLDNLTLSDFRQMREHYQINMSLSVLTFMLHQVEWHIECEDEKIRVHCEENLREVWSRLVRAMAQSFWCGFSPNVLEWENDTDGRRVVLNKIKDLVPETCRVNWKTVEGNKRPNGTRPKFKIYDGIKQSGVETIPVDNSFWYPLLMENGDHYGRKLLKPAFQPWFFSILLHLFANRYYERFGEPTPVGRAPYEDEVDVNGKTVKGNDLMAMVIQNIRNRSVAVLPNEKTQFADNETSLDYDYQIEYLESQMRGADFERYLTRLDEEMSLGLFTPILLMRTADVGSYNLGVGHTQVYQWMLNALFGDWTDYINKYILVPMRNWNFGPKAARPRIKFARMGKVKAELLQALLTGLMQDGKVKFDVRELGEMAGMTVEEVDEVTEPPEPPEPGTDDPDEPGQPPAPPAPGGRAELRATADEILNRVEQQVSRAFRNDTFGSTFTPSLGYRRRFEESLKVEGCKDPLRVTNDFFADIETWLRSVIDLGRDEFSSHQQFMRLFRRKLYNEVDRLTR